MTVKLPRRILTFSLIAIGLMLVLFSLSTAVRAQQMVASWYGPGFEGATTANGEIFDPNAYTAAHKTLPFGTKLIVTYNGKSAVVRINDRGPYVAGRDLDLSEAAAEYIGLKAVGTDVVEVTRADPSTPVGPYSGSTQQGAESDTQEESTSEPEQPVTQPESLTQEGSSESDQPASGPGTQPSEPAGGESAGTSEGGQQGAPDTTGQSRESAADGSGITAQGDQYGSGNVEDQYDNGNVEDQYGNGNVEDQYGNGNVEDQYDNGNVEDQYGNGNVEDQYDNGNVEDQYGNGNVEDQYDDSSDTPQGNQYEDGSGRDQGDSGSSVPAPSQLQAPPAELVKPGSTVERRIELGLAAAPVEESQTSQQSGEENAQTAENAPSSGDNQQSNDQSGQGPADAQSEVGSSAATGETSADGSGNTAQGGQDEQGGNSNDEKIPQAQSVGEDDDGIATAPAHHPAENASGGEKSGTTASGAPQHPAEGGQEHYKPEPQKENETAPAVNQQSGGGAGGDSGLSTLPDTGSALPLTALAGGMALFGIGGLLRKLTEW